MRQEMAGIRNAVEATTEVKSRKRKYIQAGETLTIGEVADLIAEKKGGEQEEGGESMKGCAHKGTADAVAHSIGLDGSLVSHVEHFMFIFSALHMTLCVVEPCAKGVPQTP